MFNKSSEKSEMSELTWASMQMRETIAPRGSVKERIRNAALVLGWDHSRARTIWYADERASIKPKELRRIEEVAGVTYGRQERGEVDRLIAQADALLAGYGDQDFIGAFVAALSTFTGALHRTRTEGRGPSIVTTETKGE
jgi:hypothetical protein